MRELENVCRRVSILHPDGTLDADDFGLPSISGEVNTERKGGKEPSKSEIEAALTEFNGTISKVARYLGLSRQALYRRLDKYGIDYKS